MNLKERIDEIEASRKITDEQAIKFLRAIDALSYFVMLLIFGFILQIIMDFLAAPTIGGLIALFIEAFFLKEATKMSQLAYEGLQAFDIYKVLKKGFKK